MRARMSVALALVVCGSACGPPDRAVPVEAATEVPRVTLDRPLREPADFASTRWSPGRVIEEQAFAASRPEFMPWMAESGPTLETSRTGLARFSSSGARIDVGEHRVTLRATRLGREGAMRSLPEASAGIAGPEVRADRGSGATEWWRSLPSGLEHGVTLDERPRGAGDLTLVVGFGDEVVTRAANAGEITIHDRAGALVARYGHVFVVDALGAVVPATLSATADGARIDVRDADARYPLVIDPLFVAAEEAVLTPSDAQTFDVFGWGVDLAADRIVVGAYRDDTPGGADAGSARVFRFDGATWVEEATLVPADAAAGDWFGWSVAMSDDTNYVVVGAKADDVLGNADRGSAHVFVRSGTVWSEQATLLPSTASPFYGFGTSVDISLDGTEIVVGAPGPNGPGAAHVFRRSGTTWSESAVLAPGMPGVHRFGFDVVLCRECVSGCPTVIAVGAPETDTAAGISAGSVHRFTANGVGGFLEQAALTWASGSPVDYFGTAVALDARCQRLLVGAPNDDNAAGVDAGTAVSFVMSGSLFVQEAVLPGPSALTGGAAFGTHVLLSGDGSRAFVSALYDDSPSDMRTGTVRFFGRSGSTWAERAVLSAGDGAYNDAFGDSIAASPDGTRVAVGVRGDDRALSEVGSVRVFSIYPALAPGGSCASGAECTTDLCVDGVCCTSACGAGVADCQACSVAAGGTIDGTCTALGAAVAALTICRGAAGACDVEEVCSPTSMTCPTNVLVSGGTTCRMSTAPCDRRETCDGTSVACPVDELEAAGYQCRGGAGPCDAPELCTGMSATCPTDGVRPAGFVCAAATAGECDADDTCDGVSVGCALRFAAATSTCGPTPSGVCDAQDHCAGTSAGCVATFVAGALCRPASGACDVAEVCAGSSADCPPDLLIAAGIECGGATGSTCSTPGTCSGTSASCPGASPLPAGTVCLPADAARPCDAADVCDGVSDACQPSYRPSGAACGEPAVDVCDAPDVCAGTSADCIDTFLSGVACRPVAGSCDTAEVCLGDSPACPPDDLLAPGISCRASTDPSCDVEEVCDGTSTACPADETACVTRDAGPEAGADAGAGGADAGGDAGSVIAATGCGCRAISGEQPPWSLATLLGGLVMIEARRRRALDARLRPGAPAASRTVGGTPVSR